MRSVGATSETEQFKCGDRVRVLLEPAVFKAMQDDRFGGWNDDMAKV